MRKKLRLILIIPLIIFFASLLVVFFSPVKIIPCETSATEPATSWNREKCKGYYMTLNPQDGEVIIVNNSGFLINLILLICGSFLFNGIFFLLLFIIVSLKERSKKDTWEDVLEDPEEAENIVEKVEKVKKSRFSIFNRKKENDGFEEISL